jgi:phosphoribosylformimino-5-aminoimidazole carboxamide ribotide isomerase
MTMEIIPAIDLKNGKCVRLQQGKDEATTEYSADPVAVAVGWVQQGARRLHVVNLDGAFGRASGHLEILRRIVAETGVAVQYGGGLRSLEAVHEALGAGAARIVLGTVAIEDPVLLRTIVSETGAERCIVALDTVRGKVSTRGWTLVSNIDVLEAVRQLRSSGVREILHTDVARDGMMTGPDLDTLEAIACTGMAVIASGGVSSLDDIRALLDLHQPSLCGVIIGKALYEKKMTVREAVCLVEQFSHAPGSSSSRLPFSQIS